MTFEIFSMYPMNDLFIDTLSAASGDSIDWAGLELHMVDIYSEIHKR